MPVLAVTHTILCNPFTSGSCVIKLAAGSVLGATLGPAAAPAVAIGAATAGGAQVAKDAAGAVAGGAVSALANAIGGAVATIAKDTVPLWIKIPSPDLTTDPVPHLMQQWLWPFTITVALLGFIVTGIRMIMTRKAAPLADLGTGLLAMAAVTALGTLLPTMLLKAGDSFSSAC